MGNAAVSELVADLAADLTNEFGTDRIRVTPIAENSFVGASIGLAGSGFRTVSNLRMATFGFVALDQFMNHAAKITYMFGGQAKFPILYRMTVGAGISAAAEHSISPYSMYMNVPGGPIVDIQPTAAGQTVEGELSPVWVMVRLPVSGPTSAGE